MLDKISGIYEIICLVNGKYYVGSSKDILYRKGKHLGKLKRNKHENPHL